MRLLYFRILYLTPEGIVYLKLCGSKITQGKTTFQAFSLSLDPALAE
jgi:hypothetical protein